MFLIPSEDYLLLFPDYGVHDFGRSTGEREISDLNTYVSTYAYRYFSMCICMPVCTLSWNNSLTDCKLMSIYYCPYCCSGEIKRSALLSPWNNEGHQTVVSWRDTKYRLRHRIRLYLYTHGIQYIKLWR